MILMIFIMFMLGMLAILGVSTYLDSLPPKGFCVNCVHVDGERCRQFASREVDPVTGSETIHMPSCDSERMNEGRCKVRGIYFEEKNEQN